MKNRIKSKAVSIANSLRKSLGFSEALKIGYKISKLIELMKDNVVFISFTKTNGEERTYHATLNPSFYNWVNKTGKTTKKKHFQISFYCLEDDCIKSFLAPNFIEVIKTTSIKEALLPALLNVA